MRNLRLIARLDIKGPNLVKSIQLEGLRKIGDPNDFALRYYLQGADEILYNDAVASLYERNGLSEIIEKTTRNIFIPITVGGGIRSIQDVKAALNAGADKVSINTAAIKNPDILAEISKTFGSQCLVLSIEAKSQKSFWEAYYDNGREASGLDVIEWVKKGERLGAGEILLTSIDKEGMATGFDIELVEAVTSSVSIPVICSGGMGQLSDVEKVVNGANVDAIAMSHVLHYDFLTIGDIREHCLHMGFPVRQFSEGKTI